MSSARVLAILGSGEIAPGMAPVHRQILARLGAVRGVVLDTPFGFQENADELTTKIRDYFSERFACPLDVAALRDADTASPLDLERFGHAVESANYVFAGPGSPGYALRHWKSTPLAGLLAAKLTQGGVVTFASAAAITLGAYSLPVYEIYKVGQPPHWLPGLDVLGAAGIRAAVLPHFDNQEGGTHDTRFCYLGERRLVHLETLLDDRTVILGVDEHTAAILDLDADTLTVRGRGTVTLRRRGSSQVIASGDSVGLDQLRSRPGRGETTAAGSDAGVAPAADVDEVAGVTARCDAAIATRDVDGAVAALLELESLAASGSESAHVVLRRRLAAFADLARAGAADPRSRVAPFVEALLSMRGAARAERRFDDADRVRALLDGCGVAVMDTPDGPAWDLTAPESDPV